MAKVAPKTVDQLVTAALERALSLGTEARLITTGKKPEGVGLFPDEKAARKTAVDKCLYAEPPLLKVVRTEELQIGKRKQVHRFVAITPDGIRALFTRLPPDELGELLVRCSSRATAELRVQQEQLDKIVNARGQVLENVQALLGQLAETAIRTQAAVRDATERADLLRSRLEELPIPPAQLPSTPGRAPLRRAASDAEADFRRRATQELVFAWQQAGDGREPIERALLNLGAELVGHAGQRTVFDGRLHEADEPAFPGDAVDVVRPGWLLRDELGGYLLAHAKVKLIDTPAG